MDSLPTAVWEGTLTILGVTLRVSVLDNGQRVIHADDIHALFEAMGDGTADDTRMDDVRRLADFMRGGRPN
jgi:hypothetical protein